MMPVVDQSVVEATWAQLTATERAFERMGNTELYRKIKMIQSFRSEIRSYDINWDGVYCEHRDHWISKLEELDMKASQMRKT